MPRKRERLNHDHLNNSQANPEFLIRSRAMRSLMRRAKLIAKEEGPVLIQGETGTGKTHLAGELHEISDRKGHRFMDYGCGEWSPAMLESALFGHSKDAYTSSLTFQKGLLAETNGGTLVLNDIDLLSPAMQGKLLRFLDDGTFTRLGEPGTPIVVDVRIIATSNKNLDALMKQGLFLRDLYYRLRRWRLTIPPLRERPEDLRDLAGKFLEDFQNQRDRSEEDHRWFFHNDVHNLFTSMNWNGNVRDLRSAVENIALFCDGDRKPITLEQASAVLFDEEYKFETHSVDTDEQLRKVLYSTRWNISLTSRITTLSRTTIYKRIRQNGWRQPKA